jgi:hypothetical protein
MQRERERESKEREREREREKKERERECMTLADKHRVKREISLGCGFEERERRRAKRVRRFWQMSSISCVSPCESRWDRIWPWSLLMVVC